MFSRRHPFLFFFLMLTGMMLTGVVVLVAFFSALFGLSGSSGFELGEKVGIVEVLGPIFDAGETIEALKAFRESTSIKAVVIRIDSPGGAVGPSQEIYREIRKTAEKKKTVASMGGVAASGGYYIASAADVVMANPGTITGSIGVIMSYTNMEDLFGKIGLTPVVIKSGQYKDIASPVRKMTDAERALLEAFAKDIHDQFIADVAAGRAMDEASVRQVADGRIFSGKAAQALGLVDHLGNLEDAVEMAGRLAGIKENAVPVYPPAKRRFSLLELLTGMTGADAMHQLAAVAAAGQGLSGGYLYRPGQ